MSYSLYIYPSPGEDKRFNAIKEEARIWADQAKALQDRLGAESDRIHKEIKAENELALSRIIWNYKVIPQQFRVDNNWSNKEEDKEYADGYVIIAECDEQYKSLVHEGRTKQNGAYFMIINNVLVPTDKSPGSLRYGDLTPKAQLLTDEQVYQIQHHGNASELVNVLKPRR